MGCDGGAFVYQEDFVGETLGVGEPGITAQVYQPFAGHGLILADDTPRRLVLVWQFDRSVGECTTALGLVLAAPGRVVPSRIQDSNTALCALPGFFAYLLNSNQYIRAVFGTAARGP